MAQMTATAGWKPPGGTLGQLVAGAEIRARSLAFDDALDSPRDIPSLEAALRGDNVALIAEVKRRSPSKGAIRADIEAGPQARLYAEGGAAAISVLTEPEQFGGSIEDIARVREASRLPVLRKDFHVAPAQLREARLAGASAALLIVRALAPSQLEELAAYARELALEILFEVRDETELDRALSMGARMIGVNNRNLETLEMDHGTVERVAPMVPPGCIAVAESGYAARSDVERAARAGADAVLVGSSVSAAVDPVRAVELLAGVPRHGRQR